MLQKSADQKHIDVDSRSNPIMTLRTMKYFCQKEGLFSTPELNDKLYLQYKGFTKIVPETLFNYHNLVALWLNNNSIIQIEGLDHLIGLTSLALNNNFISKIKGLDNLYNLGILNLSHNKIEIVEGLEGLRKLETINLSKNFIIHPHSIAKLRECENLSSIDLSQNEIQNSEEIFKEIVANKNVGCLYLKSTPLARGFRNYRKRFISGLKKLKFLDDRPVLQKDHRLSEAWLAGGTEQETTQKQKIVQQVQKREEQERIQRMNFQQQELSNKSKPQSFIAEVKETSLRIMNIEDKEEEEKIINKYYQNEKEQIEKNLRKKKEEEQLEQANRDYYQSHETEVISEKVKEVLGQNQADEDQVSRFQKRLTQKWHPKYEKILEVLLMRYKFDFSEVQPSFNMIIANINKKLMRAAIRFEIPELRRVWTQIELRKRREVSLS